MSASGQDNLQKYVLRLGDNALILGQQISAWCGHCLLYTSPSPRDRTRSRMPSSA